MTCGSCALDGYFKFKGLEHSEQWKAENWPFNQGFYKGQKVWK